LRWLQQSVQKQKLHGDVCHACTGLGYEALIKNYHETSNAKGPQDAAGGILKRQADIAVLQGKTTIQNAENFFNFAKENLETPKSCIYSKRTFKYVDEIPKKWLTYKLKRCSNKECCKQCRYVKFKGTRIRWPVQKLTHRTTQKHVQHHDATDI